MVKLNEITEVGFYTDNLDIKENIFEVIFNRDEQWLKDEPEETLLIDTWIYDYTDNDDRKHYECDGSLHSVKYAESIEVYKITDVKYTSPHGNSGVCIYEDKLTYKEKLDIAVKALEKYAKREKWNDIELGNEEYFAAWFENKGYKIAEKALAKIKEIK